MNYKVGMSDKKTRSKATRPKSRSGALRINARDFSNSVSNRGGRNSKKRTGYRKFSKLGVSARGAGQKNKPTAGRATTSSDASKKVKIKKLLKKSITIMLTAGFTLGVITFLILGLYLKNLERSLPNPDKLIARSSDQSTILLDRNGEELFKIYGEENRQFVSIDEIPEHTKWALLAAEDIEFYQHKGLDWKGITRCSYLSFKSYVSAGNSDGGCGASTITQQLVRNTIMYDVFGDEAFERSTFFKTVRRKLRELLLSMQVEQTLTKDEILQMYMNEVPLGGVNYGYEAAAQSYYGKSVTELDLAESAMLAGVIQSPSIHSPLFGINPEGGEARQEYVLNQMLKYKNLTGADPDEIQAAKDQEMLYSSGNIDIEAYHFVFYIKQILEEEFGAEVVERGGLKVTTTLDMATQRIAEEEVINGVRDRGHQFGMYNGSMVVLDPNTNQILAMVGSVDPTEINDPRIDGSVNIATSLRQMGSSFKPYVYLTAFERYGPWLSAPDIPLNFGNYKPENWDDKNYGFLTARRALVQSRNIPANYTMQLVGIDSVLETVEKVGVTTLTDRGNYGLSLALGAGEMKLLEHAQGFSVFATGGVKRDATGILKVEDAKGEILAEYKETKGERIFDEKDIYLLNWTMCDLGGFGDQIGSNYYTLNGKRVTCGKTGTTNDAKDLVSVQYNKNLVVAMWVGNNNGDIPTAGAWSTNVPLPIVNSFIERVAGKYPSELPTRPSGILATTVCTDTGRIPDKDTDCKKEPTVYVSGRAPAKDTREKLVICKSNDLVAENAAAAKEVVDSKGKPTLVSDKIWLNFKLENTSQQASFDAYVKKQGKYISSKPESGICELPLGPNNEPIIAIDSPAQGTEFNVNDTVTLSASARAEGDVDYVEFMFNGAIVGGQINDAPYTATFAVPSTTPPGSIVITAKVVDSQGRIGTDAITVTVKNPNTQSVAITNLSSNQIVVKPVTIESKVSGFESSTMRYQIVSGSYSTNINAYNDNGTWKAVWNDVSAIPGDYVITAYADNSNTSVTVKIL